MSTVTVAPPGFTWSAALRQRRAKLSKGTCPNPASFSTDCAIVINKKLSNKTEKTEDCHTWRRPVHTQYSSVFGTESNPVTNHSSKNTAFWYVAPPFEQCCTSSTTSSDAVRAVRVVSLIAFPFLVNPRFATGQDVYPLGLRDID